MAWRGREGGVEGGRGGGKGEKDAAAYRERGEEGFKVPSMHA
jgi:hypothetical protein